MNISELTEQEKQQFEELVKQKRFVFKDISPYWYEFIMSGNELYKKAYKLDITRADRDPVGEAHGFRRNYANCTECQMISNAFGNHYAKHIMEPNAEISIDPELLQRLEQHWNQRVEHKELTALKLIERERTKK